ncbi:hypothetical protein Pcinc_000603 [Petrolisthes cinctipes]|uniref:Uncharacterized protein n=1 Tax=Petrolisthes cinctipes TaxID=88211 RepID=A0AAE1GMY3_PETCI|nr:hypothetical protein Pcinc_000603 [Petrolisthes cinctipes]
MAEDTLYMHKAVEEKYRRMARLFKKNYLSRNEDKRELPKMLSVGDYLDCKFNIIKKTDTKACYLFNYLRSSDAANNRSNLWTKALSDAPFDIVWELACNYNDFLKKQINFFKRNGTGYVPCNTTRHLERQFTDIQAFKMTHTGVASARHMSERCLAFADQVGVHLENLLKVVTEKHGEDKALKVADLYLR